MIQRRHVRMAAAFAKHAWRPIHPFEVQAALLNACNLACVYCRCPEIRTKVLSTETWVEIVRGLARHGTLRIKFQGGEPTIYPGLRRVSDAAREAGIQTAVVTNGIRIHEDPTLLDHLDEIVVSVDSLAPEHHEATRGQGSHAAALGALEAARERGMPAYVVMVMTRKNVGELESLLAWCEARGIGFHAQPLIFGRPPYDEGAREMALQEPELAEIHRRMAAWRRAGRPLMFSAATYERAARWPTHDVLTVPSEGESSCMAGRSYVHIEPNGDVWPCGQHGDTGFVARNLVSDGLEAALRNAAHHRCGDCYSAYLNERKAVFGLRPDALLQLVRRG
ncbi:MAG TPA: radical SAM protein [Myxococcota bacterium]|nr:radical SAM protein [Myxococcota bacterium]